jgi:type I restriction enzyme M protein
MLSRNTVMSSGTSQTYCGVLSESEKLIVDPDSGLNPSANLELFGQEYNPGSYVICGSDLMIKGEDVKNIVYGNTLGTGKAKEGFTDGDGHPDERFHYMLANPPLGVEWKPEKITSPRSMSSSASTGGLVPVSPDEVRPLVPP